MPLPTLTSTALFSSMRFSLPPLVSIYCFSLVLLSAIIVVTAQHPPPPQDAAFLSVTPEVAARNLARARKYKPLVLIHHARASLGVDKLVSTCRDQDGWWEGKIMSATRERWQGA